jgi:hypothetical protein
MRVGVRGKEEEEGEEAGRGGEDLDGVRRREAYMLTCCHLLL